MNGHRLVASSWADDEARWIGWIAAHWTSRTIKEIALFTEIGWSMILVMYQLKSRVVSESLGMMGRNGAIKPECHSAMPRSSKACVCRQQAD